MQKNKLYPVISCVVAVILLSVPVKAADEIEGKTIALWNFDEGKGKIVRDASGNGHDGVIEGGAKWVVFGFWLTD